MIAMETLKGFLSECRVRKGEPFTHTTKSTGSLSDGWVAGSYYIENDYSENFWTLYCNAIRKGVRPTLTEKPGPFGPLRVDFDFKADLSVGLERQYTKHILKDIIKIYQDAIKDIIEEDVFENKMLWCMVLEKEAPRSEGGIVKDGFHLHFPFFICEGWVQDKYLREHATLRMIEKKVWEGTNYMTPVDKVIDDKIAGKPWMMYGSMNAKNKSSTPYIYNRYPNILKDKAYGRIFDHRLKQITPEKLFEDEMIGRKSSVKYYLPRFMSVRGFSASTNLKEKMQRKKESLTRKQRRRRKAIVKKRSMIEVMADLKMLQEGEIMEMLSLDRADDYNQWMDVGWTLFNIGNGCDDALQMWIRFSLRSGNFVDGKCEEEWSQMEMRDKTVASILAMARHDSPDMYKEWKDTNINFLLWKSLNEQKPNEYDVAMVVCQMYGDRFLCADAKKDVWYEFRDHRWHQMDDGLALKKLFATDVLEKYSELKQSVHNEIGDLERKLDMIDDKKSDEYLDISSECQKKLDKRKRMTSIITALKTTVFHDKLMKMCKLEMYDADFLKKIDENRMMLGCENGTLDLEMCIFRNGRPDDYITFSTGIYYQEYSYEDDDVKELQEYLLKVYPNDNLRKYFVTFMATCLQGGNVHKRFLIATGASDGAKSMTFALLELTFGSGNAGYFGKFPRELMVQSTGRSNSAGARPELARVRGKRLMGSQEITADEKINGGFVKEVTGNDSFFARGLYEKGTEIKPQFTLLMQCNEPPSIPGKEAVWSRIRVLDHESKFVKPQDLHKWPVKEKLNDQLKEKRFRADPSFREKLPDLAPALLWLLFERYKLVKEGSVELEEPDEVKLSTQSYQTENDIFQQFINECIVEEKDMEKAKGMYIRLADLYNEFKDWYIDNYPGFSRDKIGRNAVKNEINKRLDKYITDPKKELVGFDKKMSRWYGYRFAEKDVDDKDFRDALGK